jgi:membrane fusion protein, multidrug efflux system
MTYQDEPQAPEGSGELAADKPKRGFKARSWAIAGVASFALVGGLAFTKYNQVMAAIAYGESFPEPAEAVIVATAETVSRAPVATAIGQLQAVDLVDLRVERGGVITQLNFKSGALVKKGQVLLQVDTSEERADLAAAEVEAQRARTDADREAELLARGAASEAVAEQAEALAASAEARVSALRAAIDRKTIRAPFSGRVGITDLKPGQYVAEGSFVASLVGNQSGIYVDFSLPQDAVASLDPTLPVRVNIGDNQVAARIIATEPSIDVASRSLGYRALIENYKGNLPAGSLVTVEADTGAQRDTVVVPRTSVLRSPYGATVFALGEKDGQTRAKAMLVELGPSLGSDKVIVLSGLDAGTRIAADGVFKLRDGSLVRPVTETEAAAGVVAQSTPETETEQKP